MFKKKNFLLLTGIVLIMLISLSLSFAQEIPANNKTSDFNQDLTTDNNPIHGDTLKNPINNHISKKYDNSLKTDVNEDNYIYVNNSGNSSSDGKNSSNPTTLENALSIVENDSTILLLDEEDSEYNINRTINTAVLKSSVKNLLITSNNNVILNFSTNSNLRLNGNRNIVIANITFIRSDNPKTAFVVNYVNLTLKNCSFKNIQSTSQYGVIQNHNTLTMNDCNFFNNTASVGGLIYSENVSSNMNNCIFDENKAVEGGILSSTKSLINVHNCSFYGNNAFFGGVFSIRDKSILNINKSHFVNNSANYYGGVINSWYSTSVLNNSELINNSAYTGGIVYSGNNINTTILNSLLDNNYANKTANNVYSSTDNLTINNCVILNENNESSIYCYNSKYVLDENWWGINNPNFALLTNNILPNNWRILIAENHENNLTKEINVSLNHLSNSQTISKDLINRTVYFTTTSANLEFESSNITTSINNRYYGNLEDTFVRVDNQIMRVGDKITPYLSLNNVSSNINKSAEIKVNCNPDITNVKIKINDILLGDLTPMNGIATLNYYFNSSWNEGTYNLSALVINNSIYEDKIVNASLILKNNLDSLTNIVKNNHEIAEENVTVSTKLDLDTAKSFQTSIKSQGQSGSCWAFSALSALESAYLKSYGVEYDFSENNMKNVLKKYSIYGDVQYDPNSGNSELEPIAYLVGWYGPVDESKDSYNEYSLMSPILNTDMKVEDVYFIYRTSYIGKDNKQLKEAILKYGSIASSVYSSYSGSSGRNLYSSETPYADHAISIVGWDDFYSKNNFYGTNKPIDNGAYIIKNSWGESTGESGYQYVSYFDTSLGGVDLNSKVTSFSYAFPVKTYEKYDNLYQHDTVSAEVITLTPSAWIRNIYTASNNESIAGIGTFVYDDCEYEAYVYVNGQLCYTQKGNITQPGYRIVKLEKYVQINEGDEFKVDLNLKSKNNNHVYINVQNTENYVSFSKENQSFISEDGINWKDMYYESDYPGSVACLKVYTKDVPVINSSTTNQSNNYTVTTTIKNLKSNARLFYTIGENNCTDSEGNDIYLDVNEDGIYNVTIPITNVNNYNFNLTVNLKTENNTVSEIIPLSMPLKLNIKSSNYSYFVDEKQEIVAHVEIDNNDNTPINEGSILLYDGSEIVDECPVVNGIVRFVVNESNGNYQYTLVYNGSELFTCQNIILNLTIKKHESIIKIDNLTSDISFGEKINISGKLLSENNDNITGKIELTINDQKVIVNVNEGIFNYNYHTNRIGFNSITANYNGDDIYKNSSADTIFHVKKIHSVILLDSLNNTEVNNSIKISGKIMYDIDYPLENYNLNIRINNYTSELTLNSTNYFEYYYKLEEIGPNNITITFEETDYFEGNILKATFYVTKINTNMHANITFEKMKYNHNITITGKLNDKHNNKITQATIKIILNNIEDSIITNENGFNYTFKSKIIGINNITIRYDGNDWYTPCTINTSFNIEKEDVIVIPDPINEVPAGINTTITGIFKESTGETISNSNVKIIVNGEKYYSKTDKSGRFNISILVTKVGTNNLSVGYSGNAKYNAYEYNTTFIVGKQNVIVTNDPVKEVPAGTNVTITGTFTTNLGKTISNSNVRVIVNGVKYLAKTDKNGKYNLSVLVTKVGVNNLSVGYSGNAKYNPYEVNSTFNVGKQNVIVTYDPVKEVPAGTNVTITGKFTDNLGKAIVNSNVKIFVNGVKYYAKTDSTGKYSLSVLVTKVGVNNLSVGYSGNTKYNAYEVNSTFTVGKQNVIVTYNKISDVKKGKNVTITGKFTDNLGKAITNSNVKIIINSVKYYAKTDSTGKYTFTQQFNKTGTYNVTLGYSGNTKYNPYETNTTFKVI